MTGCLSGDPPSCYVDSGVKGAEGAGVECQVRHCLKLQAEMIWIWRQAERWLEAKIHRGQSTTP